MPKRKVPKASAKRWLPKTTGDGEAAGDGEAGAATVPLADVVLREEWSDQAVRQGLRAEFAAAAPFPHAVLHPFLGEGALRAVRSDLEKLNATEKETDLFRFFQTSDLAPDPNVAATRRGKKRRVQSSVGSKAKAKAVSLESLRKLFATDKFRELCAEISQCGELTERVDLSAQVYTKGAHLLCHDDVIGTRKISFIYYLTDPSEEWTAAEGGSLELYPPDPGAPPGTPATAPTKEILPRSDALVLFTVEPGVSFHSVREVRGDRARISIQGWLHAPSLEQTCGFEQRNLATLQQILSTARSDRHISSGESKPTVLSPGATPAAPDAALSSTDLEFLAQWLAPEYLEVKQLKSISEHFEDSSYAVLTCFLRQDLASRLSATLDSADGKDGLASTEEHAALPQYCAGESSSWATVGPPHLRRYLQFRGGVCNGAESAHSPHADLGNSLHEIASALFCSLPFRKWLHACTQLEPKSEGHAVVRRFRPGLDYTVAVHAATSSPEAAELDVTLAFVGGGGAGEKKWASEDVGGFECYLATDEDEETVQAQEVYRGADTEGPLVNIPATQNTLSLVMRDSKTLKFVKYLGRDAPSSRADISACYAVDAPEGSSCVDSERAASSTAQAP